MGDVSDTALASRLWQLPDGDLTTELVACEEKLRTTHADMLAIVGEIEQRGLGRSLGFKDTAALLTETLRISGREARTRIEQAAAIMPSSSLTGVPQPPPQAVTGEALAAGAINREHVQAITAIFATCPGAVPVEQRESDEQVLVDLARQAGPEAVRRAGRRLHTYWEQETLPPGEKQRRQATPGNWLEILRRADGTLRLTGHLNPETAETLDGLLGPLAKPRKNPETGEQDPRCPQERTGDALADIIALAARCEDLATQGGERAVMVVSTTLTELRAEFLQRFLDIPGLYTVEGLHRLACESRIVPAIFGSKAEPLYVGEATRFATAAQRRYLATRDRGCAFPGCTRSPKWTTAHHVVPWWLSKNTSVDNLVLLCDKHHRIIHHTAWEVRMNGHLPEFIPPQWVDRERRPMRNLAHHTPPGLRAA